MIRYHTRKFTEVEVRAYCTCGHALGGFVYGDGGYGHECAWCRKFYLWQGNPYTEGYGSAPTYPYTARVYEDQELPEFNIGPLQQTEHAPTPEVTHE